MKKITLTLAFVLTLVIPAISATTTSTQQRLLASPTDHPSWLCSYCKRCCGGSDLTADDKDQVA